MPGGTNSSAGPGTSSRPTKVGTTNVVKIVSTRGTADGDDARPTVPPPAPSRTNNAPRIFTYLLIWGGSVLLAFSAVLHFHLWGSEGYRHIPTIGPLFLLQAIVGFVLAVATAIFRKLVLIAAATILAVSSVGALLISIWWGLFGWQESFAAPYVGLALWVEGAAAVLLGVATVLLGLPWLAKIRSNGAGRP